VWSEGPAANLRIPIRHVQFDTPKPKELDMTMKAKSRQPVLVSVFVNGVKVGEVNLTNRTTLNTLPLPASALRSENLRIRFLVEEPAKDEDEIIATKAAEKYSGRGAAFKAAKAAAAIPVDARALGIKLIDIKLVDPNAPVPAAPLAG